MAVSKPVSIKGESVEFILNQSGKPTILRGRSKVFPGFSYLYQKKDTLKTVSRYQCRTCSELKRGAGGVKVATLNVFSSDSTYVSEADEGHDILKDGIRVSVAVN